MLNCNELVAEVLQSKKYHSIDVSVISRVCKAMVVKYPKRKDAIKAIKNELHLIHESFLSGNNCHKSAIVLLSEVPNDYNNTQFKDICIEIMKLHASTSERLADLSEICLFISQYINVDSTVIDIGCGFNPFIIPFLNNSPKSYIAYDINMETIDLLRSFFIHLRKSDLLYKAEILDAVEKTPEQTVDVAIMFKLIPLLQQQERGRGIALLNELNFKVALVSFPIRSMSGKQKGMESFYSSLINDNLPSTIKVINKKVFTNEMFFVLEK